MIEPSSTTALHPPAPAPCAATSAARRAPPPRSRTALGFARSALGARPRVGREGEGAFSNTHSFTFSTVPPVALACDGGKVGAPHGFPPAATKSGGRYWLARYRFMHVHRYLSFSPHRRTSSTPVPLLDRVLHRRRYFMHCISTGTFVGSRSSSAPVLLVVLSATTLGINS